MKVSFSRCPSMEWNQEHFFSRERDGKRGLCKGFSIGSRRRLLDRLNQVSVASDLPDFLTLTLPDQCFNDSVPAFAKTAKLMLDVFLKRLHRACRSACGIWRIEWKARKSGLHEGKLFPHFHLLLWGLPRRELSSGWEESFVPVRDQQLAFDGLARDVLEEHVFKSEQAAMKFLDRKHTQQERANPDAEVLERKGIEHTFMSFFDWVSVAWYHVVASGNLDHFLAGCSVERVRTWGGVMWYAAKYMSKADSENFMEELPVGRSWGIHNRALMPWAKLIDIDLSDDVGNRIRRIARRYLEHRLGRRVQRHYGLTLYCNTAQFLAMVRPPIDAPF